MAKSKTRKKPSAGSPASMLENAVGQIEQAFGPGSIMRLSDAGNYKIEGISTGALSLDLALGGQGMPRGRIVELYGPESSGKTTLALHVIASAQKADGIAAFIDAEHALDPSWAKRLGVNLDELLVSQPSYGEEALQIAEMLIKSNAVDLIVIDSVAALVPKTELDGEIGQAHVGLQARMMSQAMRKLTGAIAKSKSCVIFINQIREKIGVMFGSPETTPGGRALKFYSSARIDVRRIATLKDGDLAIFTAHPFSGSTQVQHTIIDGQIYFDRDLVETTEDALAFDAPTPDAPPDGIDGGEGDLQQDVDSPNSRIADWTPPTLPSKS